MRPAARPKGAIAAEPERGMRAPVSTLSTDRGRIHLNGPSPITLINFWNPSCPCSRYAERQARRLADRFAGQGVRLITLVEGVEDTPRDIAGGLAAWKRRGDSRFAVAADPGGALARRFGVWAAPAAVVLDQDGQVRYVGSYNAARFCDNRRTAWAEQALESLLDRRSPAKSSSPFYGCQVLDAR